MKHPELLLLPLLMFTDYFLTVLGALQKEKKYSEHFKTQHYELNPIWQKQIFQKKWFNPRHILLTVLLSVALACLIEFGDMPDSFVKALFGCLFVFFGMIIGRHLSNIMIFRYFVNKPDDISGRVTMTHSLSLSISTYQYLVVVIPMIFIVVFSPTAFILGGLVGIILIFVVHGKWMLKHRRQLKVSNKTDAGDGK